MRRIGGSTLLYSLLVTLGVIAGAQADTYAIQKIGAWEACGGTDVEGVPTCGLVNRGDDRSISIRAWSDSTQLTIQVFKKSWNIPKNAVIGIEVQFDGNAPWSSRDGGVAASPNIVQFKLADSATEDFLRQFIQGNKITVRFPNGNEAPWSGGLTGTAALTNVFTDCIVKMKGGASQPFDRAPSQPYSSGSTQPFDGGQSRKTAPTYKY